MSVRPNIYTVFGIDTFQGNVPEWVWESRISMEEETRTGFDGPAFVKDYMYDMRAKDWRWYSEVLYYQPNTSNNTVIGLVKSWDFDSTTFRALAMLYPEFWESGRRDIPLLEDEWERRARMKDRVRPLTFENIPFRDKWFYPNGFHEMTPIWAYVTKWLLDSIGVASNIDDYKWMLIWDWC